jgi:hypothetical protein
MKYVSGEGLSEEKAKAKFTSILRKQYTGFSGLLKFTIMRMFL